MQKALCSCAPSSTLVTGGWPVGFCVPQWGYAGDPQLDGTIRQSFPLHVPGQRSGTQVWLTGVQWTDFLTSSYWFAHHPISSWFSPYQCVPILMAWEGQGKEPLVGTPLVLGGSQDSTSRHLGHNSVALPCCVTLGKQFHFCLHGLWWSSSLGIQEAFLCRIIVHCPSLWLLL